MNVWLKMPYSLYFWRYFQAAFSGGVLLPFRVVIYIWIFHTKTNEWFGIILTSHLRRSLMRFHNWNEHMVDIVNIMIFWNNISILVEVSFISKQSYDMMQDYVDSACIVEKGKHRCHIVGACALAVWFIFPKPDNHFIFVCNYFMLPW